ncbi:MAG: DUF5660 family protein [Candidatus Microgenomates bacterium]
MDKAQKAKNIKAVRSANVLESLKDVGSSVSKSISQDLLKGTSEEFLRQLFGSQPVEKHSGEILPGESVDFKDIYSGQREENLKLKKQISFERQLSQEENQLVENKSNELRVQLQALMQEVAALARTTSGLSQQVEIAAIQAPANPGIYHLVFFEKLIEFIQSFRKKVEHSEVWLATSNKRANKKNYWSTYKGKGGGGSFLLSPDSYLQRSAG